MNDYSNYDGMGLAELVRKGETNATELLDAALAATDAVNPQLNAIIRRMDDEARATIAGGVPDGPFAGVPFLLKDLLADYGGVPMTMGCRYFKDYVPPHDSELVRRFKQAGLVIFGKTNTPEFGTVPITDPELHGSTLNPWNTDYSPGGSSGGSGAAVAARIVPMASGGDGGGSIRVPAACCGLVGLKPTKGRNPTGPDRGELWYGMAVEHVLTRSVRDSAAMLDATAGPDVGPPNVVPPPERPWLDEVSRDPGKLRIAWSNHPMIGRELDPESAAAVERTVQQLEDLGHHVEEARPIINREDFIYHFAILVTGDTAALMRMGERESGRKLTRNQFERHNWAFLKLGEAFTARDFSEAHWYVQNLARQVGRFMEPYDVFLCPTQSQPAPTPGQLIARGKDRVALEALNRLPIANIATNRDLVVQTGTQIYDFMSHSAVQNATGQPSISLPIQQTSDGRPVGVMFSAKFGDEARLFRLAGQLEQAHPWADRRPSICA